MNSAINAVDYDFPERLFLALAIGLLVGLERGWKERETPDGTRAAGIRTFTLISPTYFAHRCSLRPFGPANGRFRFRFGVGSVYRLV